jgi:hypothetical protein
MITNTWRLALLALCFTTLSSTTAAATEPVEREPIAAIPTMLVATDDPTGYPDPICSKCTIIVIEDEGSAGTEAELRLTIPADTQGFSGAIAVTVWLDSEERRTVWLEDVSLAPGDDLELVAEAEPDWSWDRVRFVWLRFVAE